MKFHRIIGKIDPKVIAAAEAKLTTIHLELASRPDTKIFGSKIGGDPLLFSLIFPMQHIATLNIKAAATDGKVYYWNPYFVCSLHLIGLRILNGHEAWHANLMHPQRRGHRDPKLWNIAVDFTVNAIVMQDLLHRGFDPVSYFIKYFGNFFTLKQTIEMFKDPFAFSKKHNIQLDHITRETSDAQGDLPPPDEERELTPEEQEKLILEVAQYRFFYADPSLDIKTLRPEKIYEKLMKVVPRCPKCGRLGIYYPPNHQHGEGKQTGEGCSGCQGGYDLFQLGGLTDDHIDTKGTQEEQAKRLSDAVANAKRLAGNIPAFVETEIGELTQPQIQWPDFIRSQLAKTRTGNAKNDWTRFKSRPLMAGMLVPKKKNFTAKFGCLLDTSASMNKDLKALALSQLINLDERSEGWIVPNDTQPHWDKATLLKRANPEALLQVKAEGGGGTQYSTFFEQYEQKMGKVDFLIVLTDGILDDSDIAKMKEPSCPVYWIAAMNDSFKPPFGKAFSIFN